MKEYLYETKYYMKDLSYTLSNLVAAHGKPNATALSNLLPFSLLFQQVGEVITLVHVVDVLAFLHIQLMNNTAMAFLSQ